MGKLCQEEPSYLSSNLTHPQNYSPKSRQRNSLTYWLKKPLRLMIINLRKLRGHPEVIARGLAVGVFSGCFPFFGLQSLMGIVLAALVRGSKIAAIAGTWISNPLTYVPILFLNFKVGQWLLGVETSFTLKNRDSLSSFLELGPELVITLLVGCAVVGAIAGIISYFVSLYILKRTPKNKTRK